MAKMVVKSAGRALGLLIVKCKASGGSYYVYTKLYDALVQPVIDYRAGIWGTKDFSYINSVQHRACHEVYPKYSSRGGDGMVFPAAKDMDSSYQFMV